MSAHIELLAQKMDRQGEHTVATNLRHLQHQLREKEARIARLEDSARNAVRRNPYCDELEEVLNESPQQSIAHIRADVVEEAKQSFVHFCHVDDIPENKMDAFDYGLDAYEKHLDKYAANLRAGGK